jgi:sortase A
MSSENIEGENWSELEKQIQSGLQQGVVHYPGTAEPGQVGNVFITGHSSYYPWDPGQFKDVFAVLGQLEIGDEYYVYFNQRKYTYRIREKYEVQPDNVNVLQQPHDRKVSTLMTCTPVGTTLRRLIIRADDIS